MWYIRYERVHKTEMSPTSLTLSIKLFFLVIIISSAKAHIFLQYFLFYLLNTLTFVFILTYFSRLDKRDRCYTPSIRRIHQMKQNRSLSVTYCGHFCGGKGKSIFYALIISKYLRVSFEYCIKKRISLLFKTFVRKNACFAFLR